MFDEDLTINSTILFPSLSMNTGNEKQTSDNWFFDTNFSSEEFEYEYKKNFKNEDVEKLNINKKSNTKEYSIINHAHRLLNSLENSIIEFSECLFYLLFINDMGNINNTSNQAQNNYFDYSKGHSKGISSGTLSDQEADEKILQTQYKT